MVGQITRGARAGRCSRSRLRVLVASAVVASTIVSVTSATPAAALVGQSELISYTPSGEEMTAFAFAFDTSADGERVVMYGIGPGVPQAQFAHYFLRDGDTTTLLDNGGSGAAGMIGISDSGRWVAFGWHGALTGGAPDGLNLYRQDLDTGAITFLSPIVNSGSSNVDISDDGTTVAFDSTAPLHPDDQDSTADVYVWAGGPAGTVELVSRGSVVDEAASTFAAMTPDGRHVLYRSNDRSIVADDTTLPNHTALLLHDRQSGDTTLESRFNPDQPGGAEPLPTGVFGEADLSDDGQRIVFKTMNDDPSGEFPFWTAVFLRDRTTGSSERVVRSGNGNPVFTSHPSIDASGRFVALDVDWGQVVDGPQSTYTQAAVVDTSTGSIELVSHRFDDITAQANHQSHGVLISADGRVVTYGAFAGDLTSTPRSTDAPRVYRYDVDLGTDFDLDDDGIADDVDADGGDGSLPGAFADEALTGQVELIPSGFTVAISDAADAAEGVRVRVEGTGTPRVRLSVCGGLIVLLRAGADTTLSCGSVIVKVIEGDAQVEIDGGLGVVTIPAGAAAEVGETSSGYEVIVLDAVGDDGSAVTLAVDGVVSELAEGPTPFEAWDFIGFAHPVDNGSTVNKVKGGRAVPLKWQLRDGDGAPVTDLSGVSLRFAPGACSASGGAIDDIELTAATASSLQNLGGGSYQLNWKAPTTMTSCGELRLSLGGVVHTARFQIT